MKQLLIDTQLLVLLVVGLASPKYILKHKRLNAYTENDFEILRDYMTGFAEILVVPNTLTEASNLLAQTGEPMRGKLFAVFRRLIGETREIYVESRTAADQAQFLRLGLTDAALLVRADAEHFLLTADFKLYQAAARLHPEAVENFNHIRERRGQV